MPHSLVAKLSGLKHKGFITEAEYDRLRKGLNSLRIDEMYQLEMENAEEFIPKSVLDKIRVEIEQITDTMGVSYNQYVSKIDVLDIIDKYKADKEGGK